MATEQTNHTASTQLTSPAGVRTASATHPGTWDHNPAQVPIRPAVSVLMVRESPSGIEVFVQHRVKTMDFAAGMVVFPGGRVDPIDYEKSAELAQDPLFAQVATRHARGWARTKFASITHGTGVLAATAIREVAEEAGAELDPAGLFPWGNWITPLGPPKRFDTYFFVIDAHSLSAIHQTTEASRSEWRGVRELLNDNAAGTIGLMSPTKYLLTELTYFGDVDSVLNVASTRVVEPVERDRPGPLSFRPSS